MSSVSSWRTRASIVVADRPDLLDPQPGGVGKLPVEVALAGIDEAGVAAAHGDDHVGGCHDVVAQRLGELFDRSRPISERVGKASARLRDWCD